MRWPRTSLLICGAILLAHKGLLLNPRGLIAGVDALASAQGATANDLIRLYLPMHERVAASLREHGVIPVWDRFGFGGRPLVGNPQAGLWYPPVWLFWWLGEPSLFGWITIAHLALGAFGTRALARRCGADAFSAALGGVFFALNPYALGHLSAGHMPHIWGVCWYPWAALGALAWRGGERRGLLLLSGALGASLLTGHPQQGVLLGLGIGVWGVCELLGGAWPWLRRAARDRGASCSEQNARLRMGAGLLLACLAAGLLAAIEWIPAALVNRWSARPEGVGLGDTAAYSLPFTDLWRAFEPLVRIGAPAARDEVDGASETTLRMGLAGGLLALLGAWRARQSASARMWLVVAIVAIAFAAGRPLGFYTLCYHLIPGVRLFRSPGRALFGAILAISVLAALGLATLARRRKLRGLLASVLLIELALQTWTSTAVFAPDRWRVDGAVERLKDQVGSDRSRIRHEAGAVSEWAAARAGLELADVYDWFQVGHATELARELYGEGSRPIEWLDPLGASWRSARRAAVRDRLSVVASITKSGIIENPTVLPRAYVVPGARVAPGDARAIDWMTWTDPRSEVVLELDPLRGMPTAARQSFTPALYAPSGGDGANVVVGTEAPGLLVIADTWMPGWQATLDGRAVPVYRGNHAQCVVALKEAGTHRVELRYRPPGLVESATISLAAWLIWGGALIVGIYTQPWRLRNHHSAVSSPTKIKRNGQLSQSLTSLRVT